MGVLKLVPNAILWQEVVVRRAHTTTSGKVSQYTRKYFVYLGLFVFLVKLELNIFLKD